MNATRNLTLFGTIAATLAGLALLTAQAADPPVAAKDAAAADASLTLKGKVDEVTVYRGQALVTRLVEVPGPAGLREVVVTELPERINPGSIYAESADGVEVRSVRYRIRPVERDVREEVRKLDQEIREVQDQIQGLTEQEKVFANQTSYLDKLEQFTAPTAHVELTKGVLNAETLKALTAFMFETRGTISGKLLKLGFDKRDLTDKLSVLNRQRELLTAGSDKAIRETVVFVNLKAAGGKMRLRYLVDGATWDPSYNARVDAKRQGVLIEYNASIEQMSGEDWNDVTMSLSTATPSLVANAPVLLPLTIALGQGAGPVSKPGGTAYFAEKKSLDQRRQQVEMGRNLAGINNYSNSINMSGANTYSGATMLNGGAGGTLVISNGSQPGQPPADGVNPGMPNAPAQQQAAQTEAFDESLNDVARESQVLDLVTTGKVERGVRSPEDGSLAEVSVSYELTGRTSLPSRSDRQLIQIAALPMKAEFYKAAIPVLTSAVYEEASVVNNAQFVLLNGPMATYVAGQFVGHGEVPTVAVGESFTVGLGIDSSLRARRELLKKNESIQGGNRLVDFTYQLALENFGAEAVQVRLLDRMPTAKETEVKLSLVEPGQELSADPRYQQQERKKGLLRWDVKVPAQAIGTKMFTLDYQMQMEYDKQLSIAGLPARK